MAIGAVLIVAIYVQTAILFGVYTPELFPTEIRLRANGICNTLGRGATVISPFVVGALLANYGLPGVVWLMIGLVAVQIVAVYVWGVEPARRSLEGLDPQAVRCGRQAAAARATQRVETSKRFPPDHAQKRQAGILLGE